MASSVSVYDETKAGRGEEMRWLTLYVTTEPESRVGKRKLWVPKITRYEKGRTRAEFPMAPLSA